MKDADKVFVAGLLLLRPLWGAQHDDRQLNIITATGYLAGGPTNLRFPHRQLQCATCLLAKESRRPFPSLPFCPTTARPRPPTARETICVDPMGPGVYKTMAGDIIDPELSGVSEVHTGTLAATLLEPKVMARYAPMTTAPYGGGTTCPQRAAERGD